MLVSDVKKKKVSVSHSVLSDSVTPWTVAHQTPPTMGFSRQEYWSGLPFPSPGDRPDPEIKSGRFFHAALAQAAHVISAGSRGHPVT